MSFRHHFQSLADKASQAINNHSKPPPIPSHSKPAPPNIPFASKPSFQNQYPAQQQQQQHQFQQQIQPYWRPTQTDPSGFTPITTHFTHETGQTGWGNNEAQNYTSSPQNSFLAPDNSIVIHTHINSSHPDPGQKYTSARLSSRQTLGRNRGCLSAVISAPLAKGIWPAFWLLPHDPFQWPKDGEVDVMECWNGSAVNHSCLHWGHFNGEDWDKHRVLETPIPNINSKAGVRFDFVWWEDEGTGEGRLVWYVDGRAVMKAGKPRGTRRMSEFRVLINVAVGGNVNQGVLPDDGVYEMVVRELGMWDALPVGGWERFESDWRVVPEGKTM